MGMSGDQKLPCLGCVYRWDTVYKTGSAHTETQLVPWALPPDLSAAFDVVE